MATFFTLFKFFKSTESKQIKISESSQMKQFIYSVKFLSDHKLNTSFV